MYTFKTEIHKYKFIIIIIAVNHYESMNGSKDNEIIENRFIESTRL